MIMRRLGEPRTTAVFIGTFTDVLVAVGRIEEARVLLQEGLALANALEDNWTEAMIYGQMGLTAARAGNPEEAQWLLQRAIDLFGERGDAWRWVNTLNISGWTYLKEEEMAQAQARFTEALRVSAKMESIPQLLNAMTGLVLVQAQTKPLPLHLTVVDYVLTHAASTQETKHHAEQLRTLLAVELTPEQIAAARTQARTTTLEALVAAMTHESKRDRE